MATPTNEELIALGKKVLAQKEKDKVRAKAAAKAVRTLIQAHQAEYDELLGKK